MAPVSMTLSDLQAKFQGLWYYSMSNNSQMVQDRAIFTMVDQYKVKRDLSNSAIFNDLEQPQTQISRSGHSLTLNISEMVKDTAIVTMEGE